MCTNAVDAPPQRTKPSGSGRRRSQEQRLGHSGGALGGAVRALEAEAARASRQLCDGAERQHVAAGQHHRWVVGGGAFLGDGTSEDGVEAQLGG